MDDSQATGSGPRRELMSKAEELKRRVKLIYDLLASRILSKAEIDEMTRVLLDRKRNPRSGGHG